MRSTITDFIMIAVMLMILSFCAAQTGLLNPEQIDPYVYDPLVQTGSGDYPQHARAAYLNGEYEEAAKFYLAHLQTNRDDAVSLYNLACCYGLLDKPELAAKYLLQSFKTGYTNLDHIKADPDFTKVRETASFSAAMDSLQIWTERKSRYEGQEKYIASRHLLPYRLHLPETYDPASTYPLLIGLHGYGDKASAFSRLWRNLENEDVIFVVPEAPYPLTEGQIGFSWQPPIDYASPEAQLAYKLLTDYIFALQEQVSNEYNVGQTWILGFSQGAYMGYLLALQNSMRLDGLVACGGGLYPGVVTDSDFAAARNLKIIISHGKQDQVVPYTEAENARKLLQEKEFSNLRWDEFEGGHTISPTVIQTWLECLDKDGS